MELCTRVHPCPILGVVRRGNSGPKGASPLAGHKVASGEFYRMEGAKPSRAAIHSTAVIKLVQVVSAAMHRYGETADAGGRRVC